MIRFVPYEEIDKKKWDSCVHFAVDGLPYAYSWYLDAVSEYWDGLVYKDYEAVMPLTWNQKWGVAYLYQPLLTQQLGVFSQKQIPPELMKQFLEKIPERFKHIQVNLNANNPLEVEGFDKIQRPTHHLDLHRPYEEIRKGYSGNLKRNLKRAGKHDLSVVRNLQPDDLISLFKANMGKRMDDLSERHYALMGRLLYEGIHHNLGEVFGVTESNDLCACIYVLKSHHKIIYLFPAANDRAKEVHAMPYFIDHLFQSEAGTHQIFDFEGSVIESVSRFYKSFGSREVNYIQILSNTMPWYQRIPFQLLKGKEN